MNMTPVNSSQISHIGHDPETNALRVQFHHGGSTYEYQNVSEELFQQFLDAKSVGKFFAQHIKSNPAKHPYKKMEESK